MIDLVIIWGIIFVLSLFALIKGSDYLIYGAEKIGLHFGMSHFVVGVVIVGVGTSLPELTSSIVAVFSGIDEFVTSVAVGSNIANILLVIGVASIVSRKIVVKKNLIYLDLPLLAIATILFLFTALDKVITFGESIFLIGAYVIYLSYTLIHRDELAAEESIEEDIHEIEKESKRLTVYDLLYMLLGVVGIAMGASYLVKATIELSVLFNVGVSVVTIFAVAFGTSIPELTVTVKAALAKKGELAMGNIFGSNFFNILVLVGVPGLFSTLAISEEIFTIGLPILAAATIIFVLSGISNKFHFWDGAMYLLLYAFFVLKLFAII